MLTKRWRRVAIFILTTSVSIITLWRVKGWWTVSSPPPLLWRETERRGDSLAAQSSSASQTAGCSQPRLDPWDPVILPLVNITPQVTCLTSQPSLLYIVQDKLHLNKTAGYDFARLSCFYSYVSLLDTDTFSLSPEETVDLSNSPVSLSSQFSAVSVRCIERKFSWLDLLPRSVRSWLKVEIYRNVLIYTPRREVAARTEDQYSVVTFIIDGMSQQNLIRSLPSTKSYLDRRGGLLFTGQNKVLHNSYPNMMALLSGETGGGWPADWPNRTDLGPYFLDLERQPLIHTLFRQHGYMTLHLELMETFERKYKLGFKTPPADIYSRGALLAITSQNLLNTQVGRTADCQACLQEKLIHHYELPAIEDFLTMYSPSPTFAHIHLAQYTHNDLNMGKLYDSDLRAMMERLVVSGALDNTFFLLMGDHGFQRGEDPFVLTRQGAVENNLPALYILPPVHFRERHEEMYQHLRNNTAKLTSFFDINQMLRQLLALASNNTVENIFRGFEGHGVSLFSDVGDRTCAEADIPQDYCQCTDGISELDSQLARDIAVSIIRDLNTFLAGFGLCQELQLKEVKEATVKRSDKLISVKIQFSVENRGGMMEGSFSWPSSDLTRVERGEVVRLDWYSSTSHCVPHSLTYIKPYCIC